MAHQLWVSRTTPLFVLMALAVSSNHRTLAAPDLGQQVALSIELLELSVDEWGERNAVPLERTDEHARAAALAAVENKFKAARAKLYETYGTNAADHLAFFAKHAADVDAYLDEHLDVKERIDRLNQTLRGLITPAESTVDATTGVRR